MKRREGKGAPTDLLVCFPTRAHLTLMPKAICSPARGSGTNKNSLHHHHQQHHLRKSSIRRGGSIGGGSHGSPYMLSKTKQMGSDYSEPTSPKVTCAGQIRVRPRANPCKSWQSVMEEIEKLHKNKQKKKATWVEALGFKKEVMQFLTCLRSVKFDFRCFGSFPHANVDSDDDDEDDEEEEDEEDDHHHHHKQNQRELDDQESSSKAVFSKWFMVLQENQHPGVVKDKDTREGERDGSDIDNPLCGPPPNALLLMRCRSAPAKSWQEEKEEDEEEEEEYENEDEKNDEGDIEKRILEEEMQRKDMSEMKEEEKEKDKEKKKKRESLEELMKYESDFNKFSSDIAKETWVVGGIKDILSRSKSTRR